MSNALVDRLRSRMAFGAIAGIAPCPIAPVGGQ
jgi:hypothetical protein